MPSADVVVNAGSAAPDTAGNQTSAHSHSPITRKRPLKNQRGRNGDIESDVESFDEDKCNHEMLQKRLKSVTDEKEIKRLKRCVFLLSALYRYVQSHIICESCSAPSFHHASA